MYILKAEHSFDSAHFLSGYDGKCSNIHGHRWRVEIEICSQTLESGGQLDGMVIDFSDLKRDLRSVVDFYDHSLIIQRNTIKEQTLKCLQDEGFRIIQLELRPTAENLAALFFCEMKSKGYSVRRATVYETPSNSACYEETEGSI